MLTRSISLVMLLAVSIAASSQDAEGSKEHPMFPNRMPNYVIAEYSSNFDEAEFNLAANQSKMVTKEGTKTFINYGFDTESGSQMPSVLQILRNYENAAKKIGGTTVFLKAGDEGVAVFKITKGKSEAWVKVEKGPNDAYNYTLTIVEIEAMKQEITSDDILTALNTDGHLALYINFDFGKADIKPETKAVIDQLVGMLAANPELKVSIEGHTDNVGTPATNKTLSESRARSVMNEIVRNGINAARLSSKGWGQDKPVSDNTSDEGRAKNRRVEIVKM
ncbi:MAG: OmpA family protein [Cytophagales bacterium]|nr:OmpA family protein [Cytophagales bacterium]